MRVVFGWGLDGLCFPERLGDGLASLGDEIVGRQGLVGLLETRLGVRVPNVVRAARIAQYLIALKEAEKLKGEKFYSRSLKADAWATADYLLAMRDELVASGWKKDAVDGCEKVVALAEVEKCAEAMTDGFGERLQRIIEEIHGSTAEPVFNELTVIGERDMYPALWRKLIDALAKTGVRCEFRGQSGIAADQSRNNDLAVLKESLTAGAPVSGGARQLVGDGSLCVIDADDEVQAAEMVAAWMAHRDVLHDVVVVRGGDCSVLSEALRRYGLPSVGNTERSRFRAVLQVLPLAFELGVRPVDPKKVVEFLYVQGGPVPRWIAEKLLWAMGEAPGVGGEVWDDAWNDCVKRQIEWTMRDDANLTRDVAESLAREKVDAHRIWFAEIVPSGQENIRCTDAVEICKRVEKWALQRAPYERDNAALFETAAGQARVLRSLVERMAASENEISLTQMRKMIEGVLGYGVSMLGPEAAEWGIVNEPAQIWDGAPYVVWWGFSQASRSVARATGWSDEEVAAMKKCGVEVESTLNRLRRDSALAKRAVLNARQSVVIVKPRVVAGDAAVNHPIWDEMVGAIGKEQLEKVTVAAADLFAQSQLQFGGVTLECDERPAIGLPQPLREWKVAPDVVRSRAKESFSSIEKLLGCPLAWTLQYKAEMWPSKALELPEKQLLLGKLAHAVVKKMHDKKKHWEPDGAEKFARDLLPELIPAMASGLLLPGAARQLREAKEAIPASVRELTKFLRAVDAVVEGCEVEVGAEFRKGTKIGGSVDMVVKLADGRKAVLDFKWSSSPYWYRKKIVEGKALQLAIYSWLVNAVGADLPVRPPIAPEFSPAGFFMFRHSELFFTEDGIFPRYAFVRRQKRDLTDTWEQIGQAYEREMKSLNDGRIVAKGVLLEERSLEDMMHEDMVDPPCMFCKLSHFCGKTELQ